MDHKSRIEEEAKAHANERCPGQDSTDIVWSMCADDYIAGALHERALCEASQRALIKKIREKAEEVFINLGRGDFASLWTTKYFFLEEFLEYLTEASKQGDEK